MKFTEDMKELIKVELAYLASVNDNCMPDIGPKRTMRLLDDSRLIYCENTDGKHHQNIKDNGKVAVAFVNRTGNKGYRFVGRAKSYTDEEHMNLAQEIVGVRPKAAAVIIEVDQAYTLNSGELAGKLIED